MAGTFPTTPKVKAADVTNNQPTITSIARSGKRQSRLAGGQIWELSLSFPPMTRADFAPIDAFLATQRGAFDSFDYSLPIRKDAQGAGGGTPINVGTGAIDAATVPTSGWPNSTLVLKAGDWLNLGGTSKLYMATADVTSDGTGAAVIPIYPPQIELFAASQAVIYNDVAIHVFAEDVFKNKMSRPGFYSFKLKLKEAL